MAISLDGILHCKVIEGSFNAELFTKFIEGLLEHMSPFHEPDTDSDTMSNCVMVMDNWVIHKTPEIRDLIESRCVSNPCFELEVSDGRLGECG